MEQTGIVQQQLLQHLLTEEGGLDATVLSLIAEAGQQEPSDGSVSDDEQTPAWPAPGRDKARRKTATTQELLFADNTGGGDPTPDSVPSARGTGMARGTGTDGGGDAEGRMTMPPPPPVTVTGPPVFSRSISHTVTGSEMTSRNSRYVDSGNNLIWLPNLTL